MDIIDFYNNLQSFTIERLMSEVTAESGDIIVDKNRSQLLKGKTNKDENIKPDYFYYNYAESGLSKAELNEFFSKLAMESILFNKKP